jgi:hypothetical protein
LESPEADVGYREVLFLVVVVLLQHLVSLVSYISICLFVWVVRNA